MEQEILDIAKKLYHNHLMPEYATELLLRLINCSNKEVKVCDCKFKKGCGLCVIGRIKMSQCDDYQKQTDF